MTFPAAASKYCYCPNRHCVAVCSKVCRAESKRAGSVGCCFLCSPGGWKEQMSVCTVSCQVGPERGSHRHKGPNGVTKDVQEAPLRLGEPQRGSPLSASLQGHSQHEPEWWQQSHVLPAGMHGTPTHSYSHKHKYTCICRNVQIQANPILHCHRCTLTPAHCTQPKAYTY